MVAIVAGNGLGLFNSSLNILGGAGVFGQGTFGQAAGQALVNVSNGNLVLRFTDEQLSGIGQDLFHTRTYNVQGGLNDGDADGWRWDGERRLMLNGTANTAGSTVVRTTGDGHEAVYTWNGSAYQSTEGEGAHDTLSWDASKSEWTWTDGTSRTIERYNGATGRLTQQVDSSGNVLKYSYDAAGRLSSVLDASGDELVLSYNAAGKLARLDTRNVAGGALMQQVYYTYDSLGRLSSVSTDLTPADNSIADGKVYTTTYTYDADSFRVASVTQGDGTAVSFTYELSGSVYRVKTVTDGSGTTTFTYGANRTDVTNGLGQQWSYAYDANGRLTSVQTPPVNGQRLLTSYTYDVDGNVTSVTDGRGKTVTYGYDAKGNRILERDAAGDLIKRVYGAANELLSEIRFSQPATWNGTAWVDPPVASAQVVRYAYDAKGRLRFQVSATGSVSEFRYNALGELAQTLSYADASYAVSGLAVGDTLGESTLATWAAARDKTKASLTDYAYDPRGNLNKTTVYAEVNASGAGVMTAAAQVTQYVYDEYGHLLQTIAVRGSDRSTTTTLSSTVYDGMGRVLSQTDANGTRTMSYDGTNRKVAVTNSAGLTTTQSYDSRGRLISLTQTATGLLTRTVQYVYDAAGRQAMVQDASGIRSYTFYDEAGRVSAKVDGNGAVVEYTYNEAGQRTQEKQYATLVSTADWYNDTNVVKTLVSQVRPASTASDRVISYSYDSAGRLLTSTDAGNTVTTFSYDGRGQLIGQQTVDRQTRYFYDADGRQVAVLDAEGYLRESVFDAAGRLLSSIHYATATPTASRAAGSLADLRPTTGSNLVTWYYYDDAGRQIGKLDEQQFFTEMVYDEAAHTEQTIRYATAYTAAVTASTAFATVKTGVASGAKQVSTVAYDAMGRVGVRTAPDGTLTTYEYDNAGRLVREVDAQGTAEERSIRTRYDAFGQVIGKLQGEGSARVTTGMTEAQIAAIYAQYGLKFSYDVAGRLSSSTDALGNRTLSYYDAVGRLTQTINAAGEVQEAVYNAFGDVTDRTSFTARLASADLTALSGGLVTTQLKTLVQTIRSAASDNHRSYAYDARGLLVSSVDAASYLTSYGYNAFGEQTSIVYSIASGVTVQNSTSYNKRGEVIGRVEDVGGLARSTATAYDAFGRVTSQTDGRGLLTKTSYDSNGRIITVTDPLNFSTKSEYDAFSRVLRQTDALGKVTTYAYDDVARSVTITTPDGVSVKTVRNRHGEVSVVTDGNGQTTTTTYDKDGNLLTSTDALSRTTTNTYDAAGRLSTVKDALGRVTKYAYDVAGRVVTRTAADDTVTRYAFDGQGRQVQVTEAEGSAVQRVTAYGYDLNGRVLTVTQDPNGLKLITTYAYDGLGRQISVARGTVASPSQQLTSYTYDKLGRRTAEVVDPNKLALKTQYRYNANDQVTRKIDPAGNSTWYVYDNDGRLTYTIDAVGGVTRNEYDANDNIIRTTRFATLLASTVVAGFGDVVGSVTPATSSSDQKTAYVYDAMGRVRYTINGLNGVSENVYDNVGRVKEGRVYTRPIAANTPLTVADVAAALTAAGAQALVTAYAYDAVGQVKSVTDAAGKVESYTYDAVGNKKTLTNKNGAVWNYNYDSLNRLTEEITPAVEVSSITSAGVVSKQTKRLVTSISYDALGQVISRTEGRLRTNVGDAANLDDLSQARTASYGYDAAGRQIRITSPGWYNKTTGAYVQSSDGTANTFQVTTDVTYDAVGNAVRNRVRINNTGVADTDFVDTYKVYDGAGRVVADVDALKGVTAYTLSALGSATVIKRFSNKMTSGIPVVGYLQLSDQALYTPVADVANDRTLKLSYDALGRKAAVQQDEVSIYNLNESIASSAAVNASPTMLFVYNGLGQLARQTQIGRNTAGATIMTGGSTFYYYDLNGNQVGLVDPMGYYTRNEYDTHGNVTRKVEYATALTSWSEVSLPAPPPVSQEDRSTLYSYDNLNRVTQVTRENVQYSIQDTSSNLTFSSVRGNLVESRTSYDSAGNVKTITDGLGNVVTTDYDALGHVIRVTEPLRYTAVTGTDDPWSLGLGGLVLASPVTTYAVNAFGQIVSTTEQAGIDGGGRTQVGGTRVFRTVYDAAGYEIKDIDATNGVVSYKVDVAGRRIEESQAISIALGAWISPNGQTNVFSQTIRTTFEYDKLGRQLATTNWYTDRGVAKSSRNSVEYNTFGEAVSNSINGAKQYSYNYNKLGQISSGYEITSEGFFAYTYDLAGNKAVSNHFGALYSSADDDRVTYTRYDLNGRAIAQYLPAFNANLSGDTLNNTTLASVTPIVRQSYDRWGNILRQDDAKGNSTFFSYDFKDNVVNKTTAQVDIYRADGTAYRSSIIHNNYYNENGVKIAEQDYVWPYAGQTNFTLLRTRQYQVNQVGDVTREVDALGNSKSYLTDAFGNVVFTRNQLGVVTLDTYDSMDRLISHGILTGGKKVTLITNRYDQAGRLVAEISGSSEVRETLQSVRDTTTGKSVISGVTGNTKYTFRDERGNIVTTVNESGVQVQYAFDEYGRKIREQDAIGGVQAWTYSSGDYSRLLSYKDLSGRETLYTYNDFGQVASETMVSSPTNWGDAPKIYSYYANGLLKGISQQYIVRDSFGSILKEDSRSSGYEYDQAGKRVRETSSAKYTYGSINQLANTDIRYSYDENNRLKLIKTIAGAQFVGEAGANGYSVVATGSLNLLRYDYDEFGNKRHVQLDTTYPRGGGALSDKWYTYDLEGRALIVDGYLANGKITFGLRTVGQIPYQPNDGYSLSYDAAGNVSVKESMMLKGDSSTANAVQRFQYNDQGFVIAINDQLVQKSPGQADQVIYATTSFSATYDNQGNQLYRRIQGSGTDKVSERNIYRGDGAVLQSSNYIVKNGGEYLSQETYYAEGGMLDAAGVQRSYRYTVYKDDGVTVSYRGNFSIEYALFDTRKELRTVNSMDVAGSTAGITLNKYTSRGDLVRVEVSGGTNTVKQFGYDMENHIVNDGSKSFIYFNGARVVGIGGGNPVFYDSLSLKTPSAFSEMPDGSSSRYVVAPGDSLSRIAQSIWGDSSMWYLIADANGLSQSSALSPGDTLVIPRVVGSTKNNSGTFEVYNPDIIVGDNKPTPKVPPPPKPKKKKSHGLASIVMVIVAVVASVYTAGLATAALGAVATGVSAGTVAAAAGGYGALGLAALGGTAASITVGAAGVAIGTGAALGGAIIGGMGGSLASQLAGHAMGLSDGLSWRQVAAGGLTAGLISGASEALTAANTGWAATAAEEITAAGAGPASKGVLSYSSSLIANKVVGLDSAFSWRDLAASVGGAVVVDKISGVGGASKTGSFVRGEAGAFVAAYMKDKWFGGGSPNYTQVATDAFGNILADYAVESISSSKKDEGPLYASVGANVFDQMLLDGQQPDTMTRGEIARLARISSENGNILPNDLYELVFGTKSIESEGGFVGHSIYDYQIPNVDVPSVPVAAVSPYEPYMPEATVSEKVLSYLSENSIFAHEPSNGDFVHDNLAVINNVFNTPLNLAFGVAPALVGDVADTEFARVASDALISMGGPEIGAVTSMSSFGIKAFGEFSNAVRAPATVTLYRVDDIAFDARILTDGSVPQILTSNGRERALFVNIGDAQRAEEFAMVNRRGAATVTAVEVDSELLAKLRVSAVYDKSSAASANPSAPLVVDIRQARDQYGLRTSEHIQWLRDAIVPGTVRVLSYGRKE